MEVLFKSSNSMIKKINDYNIRKQTANMTKELINSGFSEKELAKLLEVSSETVNKIKRNCYPSIISAKTYKRLEYLTNDKLFRIKYE